MSLAGEGLPKGGGIGYEIFDKSDALGTTSFVQNINNLRALEGELSRTIRGLDRVVAARVHLVLPERPLFSRDKVEPSASIVLKVHGTLEAQQVRAIRHLVASAVNGLKPQRVSIVDEAGHLLADGTGDGDNVGDVSVDERRSSVREAAARPGRGDRFVRCRPRSSAHPGQRRFRFQPRHADVGQIRSRGPRGAFEPNARGNRPRRTTAATARSRSATRYPAAIRSRRRPPDANAGTPRDQSKKSEEIVNYEISKTTKTEVIEGGRVNRISVAVLVDGTYAKNDKGDVTYQPRSKEEIDQIAALVRTAIGFDQKRGDQVEVVNLRFAETPATPITEPSGWLSALQFTKDDIMRAIEMVVMGLLGFVVLLMVVRPLVRRVLAPEDRALVALPAGVASAGPGRWTPPLKNAEATKSGTEPDRQDDRHRPDPGTGARPIGAEGRRACRQESARSRFHHPPMDEREPGSLISPCRPHHARKNRR